MKNSKFIVYNDTKTLNDNEIFAYISDVLKKGLISGENTLYCYASTYTFDTGKVLCIETQKQKYGYRIYAYEKEK